ncbi:hydrolase [Sulfurifustis variabilis]|uniref:Hydrolase n=1 Tax=Sulfurifustis variabilis TaxID=1675686 RepID=A0A1B4V1L6_9GAMM|nr:lipocalin-like domain-containing protein [Sulfurifustis variabilis]BAU47380.1 hydrolase [Sulfurifustis variabilis]
MSIRPAILVLALAGLGTSVWWLWPAPVPAPAEEPLELARVLGGTDTDGYARAEQPRPFRFPVDHGPHPGYRSEWWYFTGNLADAGGRRFGYELALFRFALAPGEAQRSSRWAARQVYMGHLALTDAGAQRFQYEERFARAALGLAGARGAPFRVWIEDWSVEGDGFPWRLAAAGEGFALDLALDPLKPVVLQGDNGLSRKGAGAGNASYYYSIPRLATEGTITVGSVAHTVRGESWLDREWSTSALEEGQAGWDWFGLQLDDGHELMVYRLRRRDGSVDPHSAGTLIAPDGTPLPLSDTDVRVDVLESWTSPRGGTYPARWRFAVPAVDLTLEIEPVLDDQELDVTPRYWEGAVEIRGERKGQRITGRGYVELTGYAATAPPR